MFQASACSSESASDPQGSSGTGGTASGGTGSGGVGATGTGGSAGEAGSSAVVAALDEYISNKLVEAHLPGVSVAVVRDGGVLWTREYGEADVATKEKVTESTLFEQASVSKTVTATALMQLWEQGKLGLDDDVDLHLPFSIRNPNTPNTPLTVRQVLTHTASIRDTDLIYDISAENADYPIPLGDFLANYFTPGGAHYDAGANFHSYAPGAAYDYSNVGIALAGYLVEQISGESLDFFSQKSVFTPLAMSDTKWGLANLGDAVAVPHEWSNGSFSAVPLYGYPDWPAGGLYSTAGEMGRFLAAIIRGGELDGARILDQATVDEMLRIQFPSVQSDQGLVWYYTDGGTLVGHDGADWGWSSEMFFRVEDGVGVVVLANGDRDLASAEAGIQDIKARLFEDAPAL
jgi:CubicO group peptidase (beta-lactamase class C family)